MKIYMAPLEGITIYTFRNAFREYFTGIDTYFTPFIAAEGSLKMKTREKKDIAPENNENIHLVPQIISNNADNFIRFAKLISERGYNEININLGCPSGTVVAKHKGAGFLGKPKLLDDFLYDVYNALPDIKISIKTRLGMIDEDEIYEILDIYNKYPLSELIVHPRIRSDYYSGTPRMDKFNYIYENAKCPLCYNGDIRTYEDYRKIEDTYPNLSAVMLGRGLIRNPALPEAITKHRELLPDRDSLRSYHDKLYFEYKQNMPNEKVLIYKMKEVWAYMLDLFDDDGTYLRLFKQSSTLSQYNVFVNRIFRECPFR